MTFVNFMYTVIDIVPLNLSFLVREFENIQKYYALLKKLENNFNRTLASKWTFRLNNDIESVLRQMLEKKHVPICFVEF